MAWYWILLIIVGYFVIGGAFLSILKKTLLLDVNRNIYMSTVFLWPLVLLLAIVTSTIWLFDKKKR